VSEELAEVVVLTGAGISAESGVPTFRGAAGLWRTYRPEDLATLDAFRRDPTLVWEWYDWRRGLIARCAPNAAHRTLAEMEQTIENFVLITQNVDGLHQRAGSRHVLELHGNLWRMRCTMEGIVVEDYRVPLPSIPPRCECGALMRPDVVWFGESLPAEVMSAAYAAVQRCRLMLVVGTSGVVYPAAALPQLAHQCGAYVVEFNVERTPLSLYADEVILGPAAVELPRWWAALISSGKFSTAS